MLLKCILDPFNSRGKNKSGEWKALPPTSDSFFAASPVAQCWPNINCVCFVKHIQIRSPPAYGTQQCFSCCDTHTKAVWVIGFTIKRSQWNQKVLMDSAEHIRAHVFALDAGHVRLTASNVLNKHALCLWTALKTDQQVYQKRGYSGLSYLNGYIGYLVYNRSFPTKSSRNDHIVFQRFVLKVSSASRTVTIIHVAHERALCRYCLRIWKDVVLWGCIPAAWPRASERWTVASIQTISHNHRAS